MPPLIPLPVRRRTDQSWTTCQTCQTSTNSSLPGISLNIIQIIMATQMLDAGVPVMVVAALLAHARSSTTLNVYAHAMPGSDLTAAEVLRARML